MIGGSGLEAAGREGLKATASDAILVFRWIFTDTATQSPPNLRCAAWCDSILSERCREIRFATQNHHTNSSKPPGELCGKNMIARLTHG